MDIWGGCLGWEGRWQGWVSHSVVGIIVDVCV